jgi:osmotically-inducible protein OsmY
MKTYTSVFVFLAIIAVAGGAVSGCVTPSKCPGPECTGDARVTYDVQAQLGQHRELAAPNRVYVSTRNGIVYLTGQVATPLQRDTAEEAARAAPGVIKVVNSISLSYTGR